MVSVPVDRCRMNLTARHITRSPFVQTLQRSDAQYADSALFQYYESVTPSCVGDFLQLTDSRIATLPPMAAVMPWWCMSPERRLQQVAWEENGRFLGKEAMKLGASKSNDFGWHHFGPVSPAVGQMEFDRLRAVFQSIRRNGYNPTSHLHVHGEFLIRGDDWVWVNIGGKHRLCALVALGWREVVVSAKRKYGPEFVRREEVDLWPNVQSGWFTREEALRLFDRIMEG